MAGEKRWMELQFNKDDWGYGYDLKVDFGVWL